MVTFLKKCLNIKLTYILSNVSYGLRLSVSLSDPPAVPTSFEQ